MLNIVGKMMSYLNQDELRIIFKFLNGLDLHNASQVCSFWSEIAKEENRKRVSICTVNNKLVKYPKSWETVKTNFIDCCQVKPCLHIFFSILGYTKELPKGCHCQYLPLNCLSISIEQSFSWFVDNNISSIFFPEIPNIQISTITLNKHPWDKGIYCEELKCLFDESFSNADRLKTMFEPIINNDFLTSCAVFIYESENNDVSLNLALSLEKWFPNRKTSIWGLKTDKLSICHYVYNSHVCQHSVDCIVILLSGTDMQTWTLTLNNNSYSSNMIKEFKEKINLKTYTIGFIANGEYSNYYFDDAEQQTFQQYFPNIPLFQIYGHQAIARNNLKGLYKNLSNINDRDNTTAFILLTYN